MGKVDFPMLMDSLMAELGFRRDYIGMVGEMHMAGRELDGAAPNSGETAPPRTKNSNGEGR